MIPIENFIDIVFDGPPSHKSGRFVEVENPKEESISIGKWIEKEGYWRLRIPYPQEHIAKLKAENERLQKELTSEANSYQEQIIAMSKTMGNLEIDNKRLRTECKTLKFMIDNGLGEEDMHNERPD